MAIQRNKEKKIKESIEKQRAQIVQPQVAVGKVYNVGGSLGRNDIIGTCALHCGVLNVVSYDKFVIAF